MKVRSRKQKSRLLRRLANAQQQNITVTYSYDDIYRMTSATPSGGSYQSEAYTYDQGGNHRIYSIECHKQLVIDPLK